MKKRFALVSFLFLCMLFVNAQQDTTRRNQNTQTKSTNKKGTKAKNQTNTNTNQDNTGTNTQNNTGTNTQGTTGTDIQNNTGTNTQTGTNEHGGQMTSVGRYEAMGIRPGSLHRKDLKFIVMANSNNMLEIQLSQMAMEKATSPAVKEFARMLVDHHTTAAQEMKQMLSAKGAVIPDSAMLSRHRTRIEMLQNLQGADFDRAYMRIMVDAHEEDLDEYEDETTDARDADIRAFTTRMLPILRTHYTRARDLRKQL